MKTRTKLIVATALTATIGGVAVAGVTLASNGDHRWGKHSTSSYRDYDDHDEHRHGRHHKRHGKRMETMLRDFDLNGDKQLTQNEVNDALTIRLNQFDLDKDGQLNLEEFSAYWMDRKHYRMVDSFQRLDEDGDAVVTAAEFEAPFANLAERINQRLKRKEHRYEDDDS